MTSFCEIYKLKTHVKDAIFLKNWSNPSYIELFRPNSLTRFKKSTAAETGLFEFNMLIGTVMKSYTPK